MRKINENTVEKFSVIKLISSEAFNEEDHPRDNDGMFVDKDGGNSQSKTVRDRVIDRKITMNEKRIKKIEARILKYSSLIDDPNYESGRYSDSKEFMKHSIETMKKNIIKYTELGKDYEKNSKLMKEK
jgi:hypothetical protein